MAEFNLKSGFTTDSAISQVLFGEKRPVMETELNELQEIQDHLRKDLIRTLFSEGLVDPFNLSFTNGTVRIWNSKAIVAGEIVFISNLTAPVSNGSHVYLEVWREEITYTDLIKKHGNEQETATSENKLIDSRMGYETSRRIQTKYRLSTSNTPIDGHAFFLLGNVANGQFVQNPAIKSKLQGATAGVGEVPEELNEMVQHVRGEDGKKHIEIVNTIPENLTGKGVFFEKSNGTNPSTPSNGGGGGGGGTVVSDIYELSNSTGQADIKKGNYRINREVPLNNPIHIKGINKPVITNSSTTSEADVTVRADDVTLENVKIVGQSVHHSIASSKSQMNNFKVLDSEIEVTSSSWATGIHINSYAPTNITVANTKIDTEGYAFLLNYNAVGGRNLMLFNNDLRGGADAIELNNPTEHPTERFRRAKIIGNTVSTKPGSDGINSGFTIGIANTADVVVVGNISYESRAQALHIEDDQENVVVTGNVFSGCLSDGCRLLNREQAMPVIVTNNWFSRELYKGGTGIWRVNDPKGSLDANLSNNGIRNFNTGMWLDGIAIAIVTGSIIQDCNVAIKLGRGATATGIIYAKNCHTVFEGARGSIADGVILEKRPVRLLNFADTVGTSGAILKEFRVTDESFFSFTGYNKVPLFPSATFIRGEIDIKVWGLNGSYNMVATLTGTRNATNTALPLFTSHLNINTGAVGVGAWFEEVDGMICLVMYIVGTMDFSLSYGFKGTYYQDGTVRLDVEEPIEEEPPTPVDPPDPIDPIDPNNPDNPKVPELVGAVIVSDNFNRADGAVENGWVTLEGSYTITNQRLVPTGTLGGGAIVKDAGVSNNISFVSKFYHGLTNGVLFRTIDNDNGFLAWIDGDLFSIKRNINKTEVTIFERQISSIVGSNYTLRVDMFGNKIKVYLNNSLIHGFADTNFVTTGTKFGFVHYLQNGLGIPSFDDWEIREFSGEGMSDIPDPVDPPPPIDPPPPVDPILGELLVSDYFDRVDSNTIGNGWVTLEGSYAISNQKVVPTSGIGGGSILKDVGFSDNISYISRITHALTNGVLFRTVDNDNGFLAWIDGAVFSIKRNVGGSEVTIFERAISSIVHTVYTMKIDMVGNNIKVYLNDLLVHSFTDSNFVNTGTMFGFVHYQHDLEKPQFDNFEIRRSV